MSTQEIVSYNKTVIKEKKSGNQFGNLEEYISDNSEADNSDTVIEEFELISDDVSSTSSEDIPLWILHPVPELESIPYGPVTSSTVNNPTNRVTYQCYVCGKKYVNEKCYRKHVIRVNCNKNFKCECGKGYTYAKWFANHQRQSGHHRSWGNWSVF